MIFDKSMVLRIGDDRLFPGVAISMTVCIGRFGYSAGNEPPASVRDAEAACCERPVARSLGSPSYRQAPTALGSR